MTTCAICGELPSSLTIATGYGASLPAAFRHLERLESNSRAALYECPECRALFVWEDHPQFFGSGNLDEEVIQRLGEAEAALVRFFLHEPAVASRGAELFATLEQPALDLLLRRLMTRRVDAFRELVPAMLDELARAHDPRHALEFWWLRDLLSTFTYCGSGHTRFLLDKLEGRRGPLLEALAAALRARLPR